MGSVNVEQVTKRYGSVTAVDQISFLVREGEFVSLLGPSGCGKTTTLRIIAGLTRPDGGVVEISGRNVNDVPAYQRNIGMVFQDYALFPHMIVAENIAFGLRMRGVAVAQIRDRVRRALELVQLPGLEDRYPRQLSGGQQQRVAVARGLAIEPAVFLLDEPLSNLDLKLRMQMRLELRQLQRKLGITTVFVTHDQGEALNLSDRVIVMDAGRIVQSGSPVEIYEQPRTRFVAEFIGESNFFEGEVVDARNSRAVVRTPAGLLLQSAASASMARGERVLVVVRPERIRVVRDGEGTAANNVRGRIEHISYSGASTRYLVRLQTGHAVLVDVPAPTHGLGEMVSLTWEAERSRIVQENGSAGGTA